MGKRTNLMLWAFGASIGLVGQKVVHRVNLGRTRIRSLFNTAGHAGVIRLSKSGTPPIDGFARLHHRYGGQYIHLRTRSHKQAALSEAFVFSYCSGAMSILT